MFVPHKHVEVAMQQFIKTLLSFASDKTLSTQATSSRPNHLLLVGSGDELFYLISLRISRDRKNASFSQQNKLYFTSCTVSVGRLEIITSPHFYRVTVLMKNMVKYLDGIF